VRCAAQNRARRGTVGRAPRSTIMNTKTISRSSQNLRDHRYQWIPSLVHHVSWAKQCTIFILHSTHISYCCSRSDSMELFSPRLGEQFAQLLLCDQQLPLNLNIDNPGGCSTMYFIPFTMSCKPMHGLGTPSTWLCALQTL
jgi:hypothetical protein